MTRYWLRLVVIPVVVSLAFIASAHAECAWVLWQQTRVWQARPPATDVWDIQGVFEKKTECDTALKVQQRIDAKITDAKIPRSDPDARGTPESSATRTSTSSSMASAATFAKRSIRRRPTSSVASSSSAPMARG